MADDAPNAPGGAGTPAPGGGPPGSPWPALGQVPLPPTRPAPSPSSRRARRSFGILIPLLVIAAVGGLAFWFVTSSDDGLKGDEDVSADQPGAPVIAWWKAMANEDSEAACAQMTAEAIEREKKLFGTSCAETLSVKNKDGVYREGLKVLVVDEVIQGDRAEVSFKFKGNPLPRDLMLAVREDGVWKVDPDGSTLGIEPCRTERREVEEAIHAYWTEHGGGELPPNLEALVTEGYLDQLPANSQMDEDGRVIMVNDCA